MITINCAALDINKPEVPKTRFKKYKKYGFSLTRVQVAYCPACDHHLNAGPNFMPKRCNECGQLLDWNGYSWTPDEFLKYVDRSDDSEVDDFDRPD